MTTGSRPVTRQAILTWGQELSLKGLLSSPIGSNLWGVGKQCLRGSLSSAFGYQVGLLALSVFWADMSENGHNESGIGSGAQH